ncbi:MAG: hypothetical protein HRU00_18380 [Myxococcales bacterium]|nr:hypothetical protein [Myxococcales bacterium]
MSNQVPPDQQGELQGSITSVQSFTAIFAPLVMTQLFGYFTADPEGYYFPGAPFFLAGVLMIGALAVCLVVFRSTGPPHELPPSSGATPIA